MSSLNILFICTGNIFRSMTAEYALKAALSFDAIHTVHSAGMTDAPHEIVSFVADYLKGRGLDISPHQPKKLTREMLDEADLAIAMGTEHRHQINRTFSRCLPLFSEIAYGTEEPLRDVYEVVPDWRNNEAAASAYGQSVMDYIFDGMPNFITRMHSFVQVRRMPA